MREVADTHRELYAEYPELYSENVASKIELCLQVTDPEYEAGVRARERYREQFAETMDGLDLLVTPTLPFVAPRAQQDERELRRQLTLLTWPLNVLGTPALAIPCGPAEDGLPASVQIAGRRATMLSSSAPAHCSRACSSASATLPTKRGDAMFARLITLLALAAVVVVPAAQSAPSVAPSGLRGFLLRVDDFPGRTTFPRTPAFAWEPYDGAVRTTSSSQRAGRWTTGRSSGRPTAAPKPLRVPAVTIPIALPWMTGHPYALYIRVRAHTPTGVTRWSSPWGFNMQWTGDGKPQKLPDGPGLVRWSPVEGANSYQVWFEPQNPPGKLDLDDVERRGRTRLLPQRAGRAPVFDTPFVNWRVRAVGPSTDACRTGFRPRRTAPGARPTFRRSGRCRPDGSCPSRRRPTSSPTIRANCLTTSRPDLLRRQHGHERRGRSALPRLRRDRPAMRERRIQRRRRRQPRLCAPGRDCRPSRCRHPTGNGCGRRAGEADGGLRDAGVGRPTSQTAPARRRSRRSSRRAARPSTCGTSVERTPATGGRSYPSRRRLPQQQRSTTPHDITFPRRPARATARRTSTARRSPRPRTWTSSRRSTPAKQTEPCSLRRRRRRS